MYKTFIALIKKFFHKTNIIHKNRIGKVIDLAWPRIVTGFSRNSQQAVDFAMIGIAVGSAGVAGMAYAFAYWQVANMISIGISAGSVSLISQYYGNNDLKRANTCVNIGFLIATVISCFIMFVFISQSDLLIGVFDGGVDATRYGSLYLMFIGPSIILEFFNVVGSRVFAAVNDTFTPMIGRAGGAIVNVVLNYILIFEYGLGVVGAAIGTVIATAVPTIIILWGLLGLNYPHDVDLPVGFTTKMHNKKSMTLKFLKVSVPMIIKRLSQAIFAFPLLAIASIYGETVVAALEVSRRIRNLINSFSWGFSLSSSALVGQNLGRGENKLAQLFGNEIIKLSLFLYILVATIIVFTADTVALYFTSEGANLELTAAFIIFASISSIFMGIDGSVTGALRGSGDTNWPLYASLIGLYVCTLPIAYIGTVTHYGYTTLYLALLVETLIPAIIVFIRYLSGEWINVSKEIMGTAH